MTGGHGSPRRSGQTYAGRSFADRNPAVGAHAPHPVIPAERPYPPYSDLMSEFAVSRGPSVRSLSPDLCTASFLQRPVFLVLFALRGVSAFS
jgi:hypothetical protein